MPYKNWDEYFYNVCKIIASSSKCLSRQIGAILVKEKSIVSTGYNSPPRGVPACGHERMMKDDLLVSKLHEKDNPNKFTFNNVCPRRVLGYESGEGMELCPAQHAEENAVSNAARLGVSVLGSTLYMNSVIPCQKCYGTLINAGIAEIVVDSAEFYDKHTEFLIKNSVIKIREFEI
uniref:Putative CMP/dCMP deaminase zinc-binding n=1 Tax=viral metagenome TaxID=1070528 RepID=A0A6H1ZAM1_9ZZZZ